jgi:hypothetical protein
MSELSNQSSGHDANFGPLEGGAYAIENDVYVTAAFGTEMLQDPNHPLWFFALNVGRQTLMVFDPVDKSEPNYRQGTIYGAEEDFRYEATMVPDDLRRRVLRFCVGLTTEMMTVRISKVRVAPPS